MNLRSDMRQKSTQESLDFHSVPTGEARQARGEATESFSTMHATESPAGTNQLMEEVGERENLKQALQQVKANKGSPGIDGITVEELSGYLQQHWLDIREQLLKGTYKPKPVRRIEIEKPDGDAQTGHSLCAGPLYSAGGAAGSVTKAKAGLRLGEQRD